MKHLGDITLIKGNEAPTVDCVIGGSPCQDLSLAGKRAGLAGSRSGLYMEQIRIIKEMRDNDRNNGRTGVDVRQRYMVWENVPGAFSTNGGQDFAAVLEEAIRVAEPEAPPVSVPEKGWPTSGCLMGECWSVAWRVLDAQFWGTSDKPLPQRRRRIALVADFGGQSAPEILFVRKRVSGDLEPGKPKGKEAPRDAGEGSGGAGCRTIGFQWQAGAEASLCTGNNIAPSLSCTRVPATAIKGVACDLYNGRISGDKTITLVTNANASGLGPTVITADQGGGNVPMVMETYQRVTGPLMANSHPGSYTGQDAFSDMLVAGFAAGGFGNYTEGVGTLRASGGDYGGGTETLIRCKHIVRRLTPLECERLQGFPDGWTDIGEWVDSKGKKHKEADSPRYKALGNSIALPPWKWVLKRLCACYERDATMASLFDGIGGFPYIWEQLNGKGSCLWASEIEEFPMAVTKLRFGGVQNE